jgi:hypothetical protein
MLIAGVAYAAEPRITGTYSNLRFGTEDLYGVEITVVYGGHQHHVIVQCAEGEPGSPEIAVANIQGNQISFQLPATTRSECPTTAFHGTISNKGLTGKFEGMEWPGFLKRGQSYWQ